MGRYPNLDYKNGEQTVPQSRGEMAHPESGPYRRLFLTMDERTCPFRCTYCFARFSNYERVPSLQQAESGMVDISQCDIIYPACDVDLFATSEPVAYLCRVANHRKSISVSTKAAIQESVRDGLQAIAACLQTFGHCLKVGISFTTKTKCSGIEPGAAPYERRLQNFEFLNSLGVSTCLVLRPLLADIADSEYHDILHDAAGRTTRVLFGEEYLDQANRRVAIGGAYKGVQRRVVNWLPTRPQWQYVESEVRISRFAEYASRLGYAVFNSDSDLMADVMASVRLPENSRTRNTCSIA